MSKLIELISCESGDWEILKVDGEIYNEGHDMPVFVWIDLIKELTGIEVKETVISDEDMEEGNY